MGLMSGLMISAMIETCQYVFCRGLFEWDDMIHNGFGCMAGCIVGSALMGVIEAVEWYGSKERQFVHK